MKTLYILNNPSLFEQCQSAMRPTDGLLLIENAVILATHSNVAQPVSGDQSFVLEEDLIARGLKANHSWTCKDYEGFVELTLAFDKTVSWL
jgi:sulfur relay protein TusB/DsrH